MKMHQEFSYFFRKMLLHQDNQKLTRDAQILIVCALFGVLLIGPFSTVAHFLFPIPFLGGKNFWVAVPFLLLVAIAIWNCQYISRRKVGPFLILYLLCVVVFAGRIGIYGEEFHTENFRYIFTVPVYIAVVGLVARNTALTNVLAKAIVIQGCLVSLFMYINAQFLPQVNLIQTDVGVSGITSNGNNPRTLLIGVSIGAGYIFLAMAVIAKKNSGKIRAFGEYFTLYIILQFCAYVITLGGSRLPIVMSFVLIFYFVCKENSRESLLAFGASLGSLGIVILGGKYLAGWFEVFPGQEYGNPIWRFGENSGGRGEKIILAVRLLSESWISFIFGATENSQILARSPSGYVFSDNSFAYVALNVGVPMGAGFIYLFLQSIRRYATNFLSKLFLVYFLACLAVTNSILWDPFVFASLLTFSILSSDFGQQEMTTK